MLAANSSMPTPTPVLRTFAAEATSLFKGISRTAFIVALLLFNHTAKRACVLPGAARAVGERGARTGARGRVARERGCCRIAAVVDLVSPAQSRGPAPQHAVLPSESGQRPPSPRPAPCAM